MSEQNRVILIVMDSVGAGALPDAARYGDCGADTLGHIYSRYPDLSLPNLSSLGLSSIEGVTLAPYHGAVRGAYARMAELSEGKDTITGHWELCGIRMDEPFRTFTEHGFPKEFIELLEEKIGRKFWEIIPPPGQRLSGFWESSTGRRDLPSFTLLRTAYSRLPRM